MPDPTKAPDPATAPSDKPPLSDVRDFLNYEDDDSDREEDDYERASRECGQTDGGFCMMAGTEHCDFACPFRDEL